MPNVLKVFLENGQTKSFKYDNKTTVKVRLDHIMNCDCFEHVEGHWSYLSLRSIAQFYELLILWQDVLDSLQEKLNITCIEHFTLVLQNMKSPTQYKMNLLHEHESLAEVRNNSSLAVNNIVCKLI